MNRSLGVRHAVPDALDGTRQRWAVSNAGSRDPLQERIDRLDAEVRSLRMSRRRLIEAADADRRAIERDAHDGLQQDLVALAIDLRRLSGLLDADPAAAKSLVDGLSANVRQALQDAAELARSIYPPLLEARGLASALRSAADSAGVTLVVDIPPGAHYPREITATLYWTYVDALSSAAVGCETLVTVVDDSNGLTFEITFAGQLPEDRLDRLRDRIEALDGRFSAEHRTDGSSRVQAWLPLPRCP
jgi:signal transduction histidine kinase